MHRKVAIIGSRRISQQQFVAPSLLRMIYTSIKIGMILSLSFILSHALYLMELLNYMLGIIHGSDLVVAKSNTYPGGTR